ncbi:Bicyclomycin resistance protein [Aquimixticola soesokkakensis]|uniref:Bcr/CflA family efflux transporter n=1 Tax=Aquimixticola soesokkakensis TaxID=1519096 RepID=A0A1Y5TWZ6_9RHOB|nr:multidrug effflux MFS transporter [Aquimixticola soesokkakensis]SLN70360.1 Bicyclomycin resistance protein [Aquimixticola soesokkakensis]
MKEQAEMASPSHISVVGSAQAGPWSLTVLASLLAFASISTDLFLPALPRMAKALDAREGQIELVVSTYLLGFGLGQLFWGPLSDRIGRKGPLLLGLAVFIAGSAGCALATAPWQILAARTVQALGASAGVALARAMVRDIYGRDQAARVLSTLMTVMAIAPLLGPSLGAQVLVWSSWRTIFWILVVLGTVTALAVATLPESLPIPRRTRTPLRRAFATYGQLLRNPALMGYSAAMGFYYMGVFGIIAGTPFALVDFYGLTPQVYALVFAGGIVGLMVMNLANARLVERVGSGRLFQIGAAGAAVFGGTFALCAITRLAGVSGLIISNFLVVSVNGLLIANGIAGGLSKVETDTGSASALIGAIQYGSGMVGSALVGGFATGTPATMGIVTGLSGLGCLLCAVLATRPRN